MSEVNKFKKDDIVRFIQDSKDYLVVRVYKAMDDTYKYDIQSLDSKVWILAMPESVLEKK